MNGVISETIKAALLGLDIQILEIPARRKLVSSGCHALSNAHKPLKTVVPVVFMIHSKKKIKYFVLK